MFDMVVAGIFNFETNKKNKNISYIFDPSKV